MTEGSELIKWSATSLQQLLWKSVPFLFREPAATELRPWGVLLRIGDRHFQILVLDWNPPYEQGEGCEIDGSEGKS